MLLSNQPEVSLNDFRSIG